MAPSSASRSAEDPTGGGRAADPFIFILGHERSGTTMLRAMLDSHPDLAVPPEAHSVIPLMGRQVPPLDLDGFLHSFAADKYFADWQLPIQSLSFLHDDPRVVTRADAVAAAYFAYAHAHGKSRYADKTPSHTAEIALLAERFPNAVFIHIVRDGRDVAASMVTMDFGASRFAEAARTWRRKTLRAHRAGQELGPARYREIHYEDLVAEPGATLEGICSFVGLPYAPEMLRYHERADELLAGVRDTDHIQGIRRPPTVGVRDWHVDVSPQDLALFDEIAGGALDLLGYPRSGLRRSARARARAETVEFKMRARRARRVSSRRIGRRIASILPKPTAATLTAVHSSAPDLNMLPSVATPTLDLSIVIPAYNAAATIGAQLEALSAESCAGTWEIIVVDNGSIDHTAEVVARWAERNPAIRTIDGSDVSGASHARNVGARTAHGTSLAFCDSDDIVGSGWVQAMATGLAEHEFMCGPLELNRLNPAWLVAAKGTAGTDGIVWFDDVFPFASSCNLGVRRARFLAVGGFDERINVWEDVEFSLRLHLADVKLHYSPDAAIHYRYRQTLAAFFERARAYGACRPQIAERLRAYSGTEVSRVQGWRNWAWLIRHIGLLRSRTGQARWLWTAGLRIGTIEGAWKVRRLYF